jgi:TatA/E family protein of Tat protein translocase
MGGLGFPELFFIFILALIIFGPRKLPELGKSLGNALGQFKRASEDFKRSWEQEVELEQRRVPNLTPQPAPNTVARQSEPEVIAPPAEPETAADAARMSHATLPKVEEREGEPDEAATDRVM